MDVFVLDTTAITEARIRRDMGGASLEEAARRIAELIREARIKAGARFYMAPSTWVELKKLLEGNNVGHDVIVELAAWITVKAPDRHSIMIPAVVFREYVTEVRKRMYRGLRVAEQAVKRAARDCNNEQGDECIGELIRDVRDKYREATRKGLLDSSEDLDSILLALETRGVLVTSDEGMKRLAEQLGIIVVDPADFVASLERILKAFSGEKS
ncbi:MAG: RNA ligase partner protein [Desulfurococcales archaeon]|nr:RNA ligase partner protein [Desulfurococcales archaeon]